MMEADTGLDTTRSASTHWGYSEKSNSRCAPVPARPGPREREPVAPGGGEQTWNVQGYGDSRPSKVSIMVSE